MVEFRLGQFVPGCVGCCQAVNINNENALEGLRIFLRWSYLRQLCVIHN